MSTLFISYSTPDRATAETVSDQLVEFGYEQPFRDDHPASGIPAGADWEQELYRKLKVCKALVALCSEHWLASKWCFLELAYAKAMGKEIFPVLIDDKAELPAELCDRQALPFSAHDVWERLRHGLERAGVAPHDDFAWPVAGHDECPYPGLAAFEAHHAGVYFGRDEEIQDLREKLNQMASRGQPRLLYVVGASGSGKSSLVKAGLLPRLRQKEAGRWFVPRTFRWNELAPAGRDWREQLAVNLVTAWPDSDPARPQWTSLRDRYSGAADVAVEHFIDDTKTLLLETDQANATPVLVLDQFEEVLTADDESAGAFLGFLGLLMTSPHSPWRGIATVRTDFLSAIQNRTELIAWKDRTELYSLSLMKRERFYDIVRRPAEKVGITFESDAVVDAIVTDTGTNDALPLLAFTMRELYERHGDDKRFTETEYSTELEGLEGCLGRVADELFEDDGDADPRTREDRQRKLLLAFSGHLVQASQQSETEEFARRTAVWSEFKPEVRPLLQRFVDRRLVTSRRRDDQDPNSELVLEVTHEALFRTWGRLERWLRKRRDLLRWRRDVDRSRQSGGAVWSGLTRAQLAVARDLLRDRGEELRDDELNWIRRARLKLAAAWTALIVSTCVFGVLAAFAGYQWYANAGLVAEKLGLIDEKDELLGQKTALIAEKNGLIAEKNEALDEKNKRLSELFWSYARDSEEQGRHTQAHHFAAEAAALLPERGYAASFLALSRGTRRHQLVSTDPTRSEAAGEIEFAPGFLDARRTRSGWTRIRHLDSLPQDHGELSAAWEHEGADLLVSSHEKQSGDGRLVVVRNRTTKQPLAEPFAVRDHVQTAWYWPDERLLFLRLEEEDGDDEDEYEQVWDVQRRVLFAQTHQLFLAPGLRSQYFVVLESWRDNGRTEYSVALRIPGRDPKVPHPGKPIKPGSRPKALAWSGGSSPVLALTTTSKSGTVSFWEIGEGTKVMPDIRHPFAVDDIQLATNGETVQVSDKHGSSFLWREVPQRRQMNFDTPSYRNGSIASDGTTLLLWGERVSIVDIRGGRRATTTVPTNRYVHGSCFAPDRSCVILWDNTHLEVWDRRSMTRRFEREGTYSPDAITVAPDSSWLIATDERRAHGIRLSDGAETGFERVFPAEIRSVVFSNHSGGVAITEEGGAVTVLDATGAPWQEEPLQHRATVEQCIFVGQDRYLLCIGGETRLWDLEKPDAPAARLELGPWRGGSLTPDEQRLLLWEGSTARLFEIPSGFELSGALRHRSAIRTGRSVAGGTLFRTWDRTGDFRNWWTFSGSPQGPLPEGGTVEPRSLVPSPGGDAFLFFDYDDGARTTYLPVAGGDEDFPEALARLRVQSLTGCRINARDGSLLPIPEAELEKLRAEYFRVLGEHTEHCAVPFHNDYDEIARYWESGP